MKTTEWAVMDHTSGDERVAGLKNVMPRPSRHRTVFWSWPERESQGQKAAAESTHRILTEEGRNAEIVTRTVTEWKPANGTG